jgi:hypothetical protein
MNTPGDSETSAFSSVWGGPEDEDDGLDLVTDVDDTPLDEEVLLSQMTICTVADAHPSVP